LALVFVPAALAQPNSGLRGTVLDTTCSVGCGVECPPPPSCRGAQICAPMAGASIVCPLQPRPAPLACTQAGCPEPPLVEYPPYEGTAATVLVRRAGAARTLMRLPVNEGRFTALLPPGRYVLRVHVGLPCWTGTRELVKVEASRFTPAVLQVNDGCVVHPQASVAP
jgi:hypothetical protein